MKLICAAEQVRLRGWKRLPDAPDNRYLSASVVVGDELFVHGGLDRTGGNTIAGDKLFQVYNFIYGTWRNVPIPENQGTGRRYNHTAAAHNGKLIVGGGFFNAKAYKDFWIYQP